MPSAIAIAVLFALLPAAAAGGGMGLPVLLCIAAVLCLHPALIGQVFEKTAWPIWVLFLFLAWIEITGLWSPKAGFAQGLRLAALVPLGLVFASAAGARARLTRAAGVAAIIVLCALMAIEAIWDMPLNRAANPGVDPSTFIRNVNRGATVLLALTWAPAAALLGDRRPILAGAIFAASALLTLPFSLLANLIGFALGLAVFALAFLAPRFAVLSVSGGLAAWLIAAPFVTPLLLANQRLVDALPESWAQRAGIWSYVCAHIPNQPWIGHGLDAARTVTDRIEVRGVNLRAVLLHPHSGSLQIWYETGAVGAVLGAAALLAGGWATARAFEHNRPAAAAAAATLASLGVIANVSFGLWQEWWIATMFLAAALTVALARRRG
jgi:O-antigen ligase